MKILLWTVALAGLALWTLAAWALGAGLQGLVDLADAGRAAALADTLAAWLERPWIAYWLDAGQVQALQAAIRDAATALAQPGSWARPLVTLLQVAIGIAWFIGVVLAAATALALRWALRRWGPGRPAPQPALVATA